MNKQRAQALAPKRVAILTNILLYHRVALLESLARTVSGLRVFVSAYSEPDRKDPIQWGSLDVVAQRSFSWSKHYTNVQGFRDVSHIHVPIDTLLHLQRYAPEIVITGEFGTRSILAGFYRTLHPSTKMIIWATLSQRTEESRGRVRVAVRRWLLSRADAAFVNGQDGEQYVRSLGFVGPTYVVPYVVDVQAFAGPSEVCDDGRIHLLYAGQLIERKGIYPFCLILAKWCGQRPECSVFLRIAGEGPERDRLNTLSKPPNLEIEYTGHLSGDQLRRAYHQASIYVFPTFADEWGVVVNEALSAGVPLLASQFSVAAVELIRDSENGWLFDPTDESNTHDALERALDTDFGRLRIMSENAVRSVAEYTPEKVAATMRCALSEVWDSRS